ncbi:MAG: pyridoxal 5'-phosphate synthase glutaminase subunit PdxT [Polyangiaceae bacterium]
MEAAATIAFDPPRTPANRAPGLVGVLALQGGFAAHARALERLGHPTILVRTREDLARCEGLVLPGGESTVQLKLIAREGLEAPLRAFVAGGKPVLATCAGLILSASRVLSPEQASFAFIDVTVERNAWGRQTDSFEAVSDAGDLPVIAIRAPRIVRVGPGVEVLATLRGEPILVRQRSVTGAIFHPELTDRLDVHAATFGHPGRAPSVSH